VDTVFDIIAEPNRRAILSLLVSSEQSVGEIERQLRMPQPTVSKHLRVLRDARLVQAEERGREHHYALDARPLGDLQREWLDRFAPHWQASLERLKHQAEEEG
jgi:DNA-binding transcriptional ArsR family regulator